MSDLKTVIGQVIQKVEKHRDLYARSEQSVRDQLINPILKVLGWDPSEPDFVHANVTNDDGKIPDYTLLKEGKKRLVLEAKKLSKNLDDSKVIRQLADYCYPQGIEFGILTDGIIWQLFDTFEKNPNNRIVWTIDISQYDIDDLSKLEMLNYHKIDNLEDELIYIKVLNTYFDPIFQNKNTFMKWIEGKLKTNFLETHRVFRFKEELLQDYITGKINYLLGEDSISEKVMVQSSLEEPFTPILAGNSANYTNSENYRLFNIQTPDDLSFTKIVSGRIESEFSNSWNELVKIILRQLILSNVPIKEIMNVSSLNIKEGQHTDIGYSLIENINYSVQNISAVRAGAVILLLAQKYGKKIEIDYYWRDKGVYPNEYGKITTV